jgi:hypothetical protein
VFTFYTWRDAAELALLSGIIYFFLRWLNEDTSGYPLCFLYGYSALTFGTYCLQLYTISTLLLIALPITITLLIIIHQHTLQKRFITYKVIKPLQEDTNAWLEEFIGTCLGAFHKQKDIFCLIERNDRLKELMDAPFYLYGDLKKSFMDVLVDHLDTANNRMLWINQQGKIIAINACLASAPQNTTSLPIWKQQALILTHKTDAIILKTCSTSRLFTVIAQGRLIEELPVSQALALLKRYLTHQPPPTSQDATHAYQRHAPTQSQPT